MEQPGKPSEGHSGQEADDAAHSSPWLLWMPVAFLAYVLALGPAARLHNAVPQTRRAIEAAYFWVSPLAGASPTFMKAVRWYTEKVWGAK
jgi:hypothetical protein